MGLMPAGMYCNVMERKVMKKSKGKRRETGIFISRADHCNSYHGSAGGSTGTAVSVLYT